MTAINNLITGVRQDLQAHGLPANDEAVMQFLAGALITMSQSTSSGYMRATPLKVKPLRLDHPKPDSPTELGAPKK